MSAGAMLPPLLLELKASSGELTSKLKEGSASVDKYADSVEKGNVRSSAAWQKASGVGKAALFGTAAAVLAVGAGALDMGMQFQTATSQIAANAGITQAQAMAIGKAFIDTGFKTEFSATQMSSAYAGVAAQLGLAQGHTLNAAQALQVMNSASDLATATGQDLSSVTSGLANVMATYRIKAAGAAGASDVLFNTSRYTGIGIGQLSTVMDKLHARLGFVAPSLGDVGGLMVDLAQHGVTGARGAMVVNTAFQTLIGGSKATSGELKTLGVNVYNSKGQFVGMQSVIGQLEPHFKKMTQAQQELAAKTLFGSGAAQVMNSMVLAGVPAFQKATAAASRHGSVSQAAAMQLNNLQGRAKQLEAGMQNLGIIVGNWLIPKVTSLIAHVTLVIGWFMKHKTAAEVLGGVILTVLVGAIMIYITNLAIAAGESVADFAKMIGSGAKWAAQHAKSFAMSTLSAAKWVAANAGAIAKNAAQFASSTAEFIAQSAERVAAFVAESAAAVVSAATTAAAWVAANLAMIAASGGILLAIGAIVLIAIYVAKHWSAIWGGVKHVFDDVVRFVQGHAKIIGAAILIMMGPLGLLIGAAVLLGKHWHAVWDGIKDVVAAVWSALKATFGFIVKLGIEWIKLEVQGLKTMWTDVWGAISAITSRVWSVIKTVMGAIVRIGIDGIKDEINGLKKIWDTVWNGIKTAVSNTWGVLQTVMGAIVRIGIDGIKNEINGLKTIWDTVWGAIQSVVQTAWSILSAIFDKITSAIGNLLGPLGKVVGLVGKVGGLVGKGIGGAAHMLGFADGGVVPGPIGAPQLAIVHGGERIFSNQELAAGGSAGSGPIASLSGGASPYGSGGGQIVLAPQFNFNGAVLGDRTQLRQFVLAMVPELQTQVLRGKGRNGFNPLTGE